MKKVKSTSTSKKRKNTNFEVIAQFGLTKEQLDEIKRQSFNSAIIQILAHLTCLTKNLKKCLKQGG